MIRESYPAPKKRQKRYYSGKKKRHTLKTQVVVYKKTKQIICTNYASGKRHDFRLFKESKTNIHPDTNLITDTGYQGIQKIHVKSELPKQKTKKNPLTKQDKKNNQKLASTRARNENVIGMLLLINIEIVVKDLL